MWDLDFLELKIYLRQQLEFFKMLVCEWLRLKKTVVLTSVILVRRINPALTYMRVTKIKYWKCFRNSNVQSEMQSEQYKQNDCYGLHSIHY